MEETAAATEVSGVVTTAVSLQRHVLSNHVRLPLHGPSSEARVEVRR
jgi:hypothetical protein